MNRYRDVERLTNHRVAPQVTQNKGTRRQHGAQQDRRQSDPSAPSSALQNSFHVVLLKVNQYSGKKPAQPFQTGKPQHTRNQALFWVILCANSENLPGNC
ncbi:hypothetical protein GALL_468320 [mine drainage metagenome]|uniref:Uncharacterized protein n=1 Tax=mine drainage metagenome TaxID=410659 RepID=A0A1J5PVG5_9ZZZZ